MQKTSATNLNSSLIFVYDLPENSLTAIKLAKVVKEITGYCLEFMPILCREPEEFFCTAVI